MTLRSERGNVAEGDLLASPVGISAAVRSRGIFESADHTHLTD